MIRASLNVGVTGLRDAGLIGFLEILAENVFPGTGLEVIVLKTESQFPGTVYIFQLVIVCSRAPLDHIPATRALIERCLARHIRAIIPLRSSRIALRHEQLA